MSASKSASGRPPSFQYHKIKEAGASASTLHCEDIPLTSLADRFGTPLYVYSASSIRQRYRAFEHAFRRQRHTVCYSVKANSSLAILRLLAGLGAGFDVVSGGELERVLQAGRRLARKVVFSGVGKTAEEMRAALQAGILLFNVESESELGLLAECAARLNKHARISLRVNPDVPARTHPHISTGLHQHKFGVPLSQARNLYAQAAGLKALRVAGVSMHIGSQITRVGPFADAMRRIVRLIQQLRADGLPIHYLDAGGGLGIAYSNSSPPPATVSDYAGALLRPLSKLDVHLLLEPGRWLVGPAGILLTRVLYRKSTTSRTFVVVDAAMNDLLRPSLYDAYHEIVPVQPASCETELVDVVGPVCETGDFLARNRGLPFVPEGGLLAVLDAGAYGMALSSNYNTRPRAAEVLVDGSAAKLIRRRETMADLLRCEK